MPLFKDRPLNATVSSFHTVLQKDLELVSALHQIEDHDAPFVSNYMTAIQNTLVIFASITVSFIVFCIAIRNFSKNVQINQAKKLEIAYQATNLCVNLTLGLYGIYHYNLTLPRMQNLTVTERIVGFDQNSIFICSQIGYNLWSLPVGYFLMNESKAMISHHIATMLVSLISGLSKTGFRYHTVFFFGLIEISSVPLAIMNFCKNNKGLAQQFCPKLRDVIRPIFAATFLTTRVFMWTPNITDVLRSSIMLFWTSPSLGTSIGMLVFILSVSFLTLLQYYWGYKVMKGVMDKVRIYKVKRH